MDDEEPASKKKKKSVNFTDAENRLLMDLFLRNYDDCYAQIEGGKNSSLTFFCIDELDDFAGSKVARGAFARGFISNGRRRFR